MPWPSNLSASQVPDSYRWQLVRLVPLGDWHTFKAANFPMMLLMPSWSARSNYVKSSIFFSDLFAARQAVLAYWMPSNEWEWMLERLWKFKVWIVWISSYSISCWLCVFRSHRGYIEVAECHPVSTKWIVADDLSVWRHRKIQKILSLRISFGFLALDENLMAHRIDPDSGSRVVRIHLKFARRKESCSRLEVLVMSLRDAAEKKKKKNHSLLCVLFCWVSCAYLIDLLLCAKQLPPWKDMKTLF